MVRLARVSLPLLLGLLAGCGTVMNIAVPTRQTVPDAERKTADAPATVPAPPMRHVYGGVEYDWAAVRASLRNATAAPLGLFIAASIALDLPLSAVADTLTLPYTLRKPDSPPVAPTGKGTP